MIPACKARLGLRGLFRDYLSRVWYKLIRTPDSFGAGTGKPGAIRSTKTAGGSMNRRDLILAILAAAEGRPYTPVQIQKAVFVVCDQFPDLIDDGPGFSFEPYDYGPFDSDVYSEISELEEDAEATVAPSADGNWNTYAASDYGLIRGRELLDAMGKEGKYIQRISDWVRSLSFNQLVKSIYEAYPEMRANSIFRG